MKKLTTFIATLGLVTGLAFAQAPADTFVLDTLPGGPVTVIPARGYDSASGTILEQVYETLYTYDGAAIDEFVPALATNYTTSQDGKTYTFTLRDGVQFHSGNTLSCKDVEYSFQFGMVLAHPEGAVSYLTGEQFLGTQIDGSDPAAYQEAVTYEMIDSVVECPDGADGQTVQLNLVKADPALISILAYTAYGIMDSEWAKSSGFWDGTEATWTEWIGRNVTEEPINTMASGTGAYELVSTDSNQTVLRAFDDYWGGEAPIENAVVRYVDEDSTRILNIQQGNADRVVVNDRASLVQLRGAPGVEVLEDPEWSSTSVTTVFFNFDIDTAANEDVGTGELGGGIPSDFFADPNVRRGFAHLFDHQAFIEQLYSGQGRALTVGMPPSFLGYNEDVPIRTLDLEAAEEYFRQAFDGQVWEQGFEFTAIYNAGNSTRQAALEIMADNLSFINPKFVMNVRSLPWADFLTRTGQRKVPMFALGWGADYADPKNFINTFYSNDGFYASRTGIHIEPIQELIEEAAAITDPAERAFLYREIANLHYEYAPLIPVPQQTPFLVVNEDLEGVYYNPMLSSVFLFKDVSKN